MVLGILLFTYLMVIARCEDLLWATMEIYDNSACTVPVSTRSFYGPGVYGPGKAGCLSFDPAPRQQAYARLTWAISENTFAVVTREQTCGTNYLAQTFAAFRNAPIPCVLLGNLNGHEGIKIFPSGVDEFVDLYRSSEAMQPRPNTMANHSYSLSVSSAYVNDSVYPFERPRDLSLLVQGWLPSRPPRRRPRPDRKSECTEFIAEHHEESYTNSARVSTYEDCRGSDGPCTITIGMQSTKQWTTTWSVSSGVKIGFIDFSATFGKQYAETVSSTSTSAQMIAAGQMGFLSAMSGTTIFRGRFAHCPEGMPPQAEVTVLHKDAIHHAVVHTNYQGSSVVD